MTAVNFYRVLGVDPDASADEIRAAYARLVKQHHPDATGRLPERLQEVQHAYRCLTDPDTRAAHDRDLAAAELDHVAHQRRLQRRLRRYDRRHPPTPLPRPWWRRWPAFLLWGGVAAGIVRLALGLFGAEPG